MSVLMLAPSSLFGATRETLLRRVRYGGRKGKRAATRLRTGGYHTPAREALMSLAWANGPDFDRRRR